MQLKAYKAHLSKLLANTQEDGTERYEFQVLNKALDLHKAYMEIKLSKSPRKNIWVQTTIPNES